jgi:hypothetical protein
MQQGSKERHTVSLQSPQIKGTVQLDGGMVEARCGSRQRCTPPTCLGMPGQNACQGGGLSGSLCTVLPPCGEPLGARSRCRHPRGPQDCGEQCR